MKRILGVVATGVLMAAACGKATTRPTPSESSAGSGGEAGEEAGGAGGAGTSGQAGKAGSGASGGMGGVSGKGGAGAGGGADCTSEPSAISGLSFIVKLQADDTEPCCPDIMGPTIFHFEQAATGLSVVIGSEGQAFRGAVTPQGNFLSVEAGLPLRDFGDPYSLGAHNGVFVDTLSLCFHPPRDSSAYLDGQGSVRVVRNGDDYVDEYVADVAFNEALWDDAPPALPPSQTLNPLDPANVPASEPLELGAVAALDDAAQTPLEPVERAGTVVAFRVSAVLPLSFEARIGVDAKDLQGNKLAPGSVIRTDDDPGVQPQDGFETELKVLDYGRYSAGLVGGDRALEGAQSLEVPGGAVALLHLERPTPSATHVRFDLKPEPRLTMVPASFVVRAGVVGGSRIVTRELVATDGTSGEGGAGGEGGASSGSESVRSVELELSEPGDTVLLEISAPFIELSASTDVGAIVDRLRIE